MGHARVRKSGVGWGLLSKKEWCKVGHARVRKSGVVGASTRFSV